MSIQAMTWALEEAPDVPAQLVSTLIALANHAGRDGSACYPSQETIAKYTRKTVRQVRRDLDKLVELQLIRPGDQRHVAHFRPDHRPLVWDLAMDRKRPDTDVLPRSGDDRTPVTERPDMGDRHDRTPVSAKPKEEPNTEPKPSAAPPGDALFDHPTEAKPGKRTPAEVEALFDEFWKAYPRKDGKKKARESWDSVCKAGTDPRELINAAVNFTRSRQGEDPRFTPYAATWLNQERWKDEPTFVRNGHRPANDLRSMREAAVLDRISRNVDGDF